MQASELEYAGLPIKQYADEALSSELLFLTSSQAGLRRALHHVTIRSDRRSSPLRCNGSAVLARIGTIPNNW